MIRRLHHKVLSATWDACHALGLRWFSPRSVFTHIYRNRTWGERESVSGPGSELAETVTLRAELPRLLTRLGVRTLLDAPCGDYNWMRHTALDLDEYIGAEVVRELTEANSAAHASAQRPVRRFITADITRDPLPRVDAILCRDCLVHLSLAHIAAAIENFRRSGSTFLLTTTFPGGVDANRDIATGQWRRLDLRLPPFNFPEPVAIFNENTAEGGREKSLAAWRISDLPRPAPPG
ncbi:MAG: class I SAM-dependent methyltransferase [Phycisphaerales bacterium]|nr:class I SAM-dependent methyltransferase [Phycisphaerales bacterium]